MRYYPNSGVLSIATAISRNLPLNFFMQRYREAYAAAFVDAVVADKPVAVGRRDGRSATA